MNACSCPYCGMCKNWSDHGITVFGDRQTIHYQGKSAYLSQSRLIAFETLFDDIGCAVSKQKIYDALYWDTPEASQPDPEIIHILIISQIRKRLTPLGLEITTVLGFGYRLEIPTNDTNNRSAA